MPCPCCHNPIFSARWGCYHAVSMSSYHRGHQSHFRKAYGSKATGSTSATTSPLSKEFMLLNSRVEQQTRLVVCREDKKSEVSIRFIDLTNKTEAISLVA